MSSDFGYINARVRGLKSRLLGPEFYNQALGDSDFSAFSATLSQTDYMQDLEEAQASLSGLTAVDSALAGNFRRLTRSILKFSDGWPHELAALLLLKYDLANIKAVIRTRHAERPAEDARAALLPAGQIKPAILEQMAQASDVASAVQVLAVSGHPLAAAARDAVRTYQDDRDLFGLELALDRAYTQVLIDTAARLPLPREFREWIRLQADATNLRTALKLRGRPKPDADLFVDSGKGSGFSRDAFNALIADEGGQGLSHAADGPFAAVADTETLSDADAVIRGVLDERVRRLAIGDPLGPFVLLDYLRRKEREVARLRLLARGKFYSVPREQLERELGSGDA